MKTKSSSILAIAFAASALSLLTATATQASDYGTRTITVTHCAPRYVCTEELCRRTECRYALDHCGRRVSIQVTVITYADRYSDGSRRTYTRAYRA